MHWIEVESRDNFVLISQDSGDGPDVLHMSDVVQVESLIEALQRSISVLQGNGFRIPGELIGVSFKYLTRDRIDDSVLGADLK